MVAGRTGDCSKSIANRIPGFPQQGNLWGLRPVLLCAWARAPLCTSHSCPLLCCLGASQCPGSYTHGVCYQRQLLHSPSEQDRLWASCAPPHNSGFALNLKNGIRAATSLSLRHFYRASFAFTAPQHGGEMRNMHRNAEMLQCMFACQCRDPQHALASELLQVHVRKNSSLETRVVLFPFLVRSHMWVATPFALWTAALYSVLCGRCTRKHIALHRGWIITKETIGFAVISVLVRDQTISVQCCSNVVFLQDIQFIQSDRIVRSRQDVQTSALCPCPRQRLKVHVLCSIPFLPIDPWPCLQIHRYYIHILWGGWS